MVDLSARTAGRYLSTGRRPHDLLLGPDGRRRESHAGRAVIHGELLVLADATFPVPRDIEVIDLGWARR